MTTTVSRRELTRWASEVSGGPVTNLEKQCCTGAIYCQMVEAARPGVVDMRKVNLDADKNNALGNYKALQVALGKIGVEAGSMDIQNLTNGQPQATMDLLQSLHQHLGGEGAAQTPRGLSNLDPSAANSGSRKRKAALPSGLPIRKARTAKALEMEASLKVVAEDEGAAEAEAAEAAEASRVESLESELLACGGRLRRSEEETCAAREEADFYYAKLARIEARPRPAPRPGRPPTHAPTPYTALTRGLATPLAASLTPSLAPLLNTPHHPRHTHYHHAPTTNPSPRTPQEACELIGPSELAAAVRTNPNPNPDPDPDPTLTLP